MAAKMLSFDADARKALLLGVEKLARAVKATAPFSRGSVYCGVLWTAASS